MSTYHDDLALAQRLADEADAITLDRFNAADLSVDTKPDMTPVSDADVDVEKLIRELLSAKRPDDALIGEEFGGNVHLTGRQWVIDPIDGTKNFVRGVPVWATLISLLVDGEPVVGVISAPSLGRRWWASKGEGAFRRVLGGDEERIEVSKVSALKDASMSFSSLAGWKDRQLLDAFISLTENTWRLRGFGDFLSYCLLAEGAVDIAGEPEVSLWDLAALSVLVTEAGGRFTSLAGVDGPHGGDALATNGLLHGEVLKALE